MLLTLLCLAGVVVLTRRLAAATEAVAELVQEVRGATAAEFLSCCHFIIVMRWLLLLLLLTLSLSTAPSGQDSQLLLCVDDAPPSSYSSFLWLISLIESCPPSVLPVKSQQGS